MKRLLLKKSLVICIVLLCSLKLYSQPLTYSWAFDIGLDNSSEKVFDITTNTQNDICLVGSIEQATDVDPGPGTCLLQFSGSQYESNFILVKYSSNGALLWGKIITCPVSSGIAQDFDNESFKIITDVNDNIYLTGNFRGNIDFDPSSSQFILSNPTDYYRYFIAKYNSNGNFINAITIGGSDYTQIYYQTISVDIKNNNNLVISGSFKDSIVFDPLQPQYSFAATSWQSFFAEYTSDLNFSYAKNIHAERTKSCTIDKFNNVYIGGYFSGEVDFDPGNATFSVTSTNAFDPYLAKYDNSGNFLWVVVPSASDWDDYGYEVEVDSSGNSYLFGTFGGSVSFEGLNSNYLFTSTGSVNSFLLKCNENGEIIKAIQVNGDYAGVAEMGIDGNQSLFISGNFSTSIVLNGNTINSANNSVDFFVATLNDTLGFTNFFTIGGDYEDIINSIVVDDQYNIICAGNFSENVDFDPGSSNVYLTSPFPSFPGLYNNIFVAKYLNPDYTRASNVANDIYILISPNPAGELITFNLPAGETLQSIKIYNQNGQLIRNIKNKHANSVQTYDLNAGMYFVRIDTFNKYYFGKIVKQ